MSTTELSSTANAATAVAQTGHLDGIDDEGRIRFRPEGAEGSEPAAIATTLPDGVLLRAARTHARALAVRTADPVPGWVVVGLVRERLADTAIDHKGSLQVSYEGESLRLAADRDLSLVCGKATVTLRFDGRIELNGTNILSASRGPHRIKGATVAIN